MNKLTQNIRELSSNLLKNNKVDMVIGFKKGTIPMAVSPMAAHNIEQTKEFIWDSNCGINLANFISDKKEKIGIIAKGCDSRNIVTHITENKISRDKLHIIGVPCTGMIDKIKLQSNFNDDITDYSENGEDIIVKSGLIEKNLKKSDYLKSNCKTCMHRNPVIYDELAAELVQEQKIEDQFADVKKIESLSIEDKWNYFDNLLKDCIRCYACKNACPLCYCPSCFVNESNPQWVGKGQDKTDIKTFHFLRAYHCAGRCTDCGACVQACPMNINVRDFTRKLIKDSYEIYGWEAGLDITKRPLLDTFSLKDDDSFIK
ncbi:MAG: 4Fe-4S ferredoxin [Desulfobacteraceae bacterium 4572_130]|nr:MAG: 4Fe-4S ferredoxin [Desulfobacteraceae bacterium 4572_130]